MRVSEQLIKRNWLPVLIVALAMGSPWSAATGQIVVPTTENFSDSTPEPAAGSALEWLNQARTAMSQGNRELAEHYIQIAEGLYAQRPAGTDLNYTPQMARQELANMQGTAPASPQAPVASRQPTFEPIQLPTAPQAAPTGMKDAARNAMLQARQALAKGDVAAATSMVNSAKGYNVNFAELGDSPRAIETAIFHQNNLAELARTRHSSYNQQAAKFLLDQAQVLIEYQDYDTATTLIEGAKQFPVEFTSETGTPESLLSAIQSARQNPTQNDSKTAVMKLMSQAQLAMDQRKWQEAKSFIDQAKSFQVPDSQFAAGETRPWQLELQVQQALNMQQFSPSTGVVQTALTDEDAGGNVVQADYNPANDNTRNAQVSAFEPMKIPGATTQPTEREDRLARQPQFDPIPSRGMQLYRSGLQALDNADKPRAREYFEMAWRYQEQLDTATRQAIQDQLTNLSPAAKSPVQQTSGTQEAFTPNNTQMVNVDATKQAVFRKLQGEVFRERGAAERLLESNPRAALEKMTMVRSRIAQAEIDADSRRPLLTIIDRDISEMQRYIDQNLPEIINDETNAANLQKVELRRQRKIDVETQIQKLIEDYNKLIDEQRYSEAQAVVRQARELDPESEIVAALTQTAQFESRNLQMQKLKEDNEQGVYDAFRNAQRAGVPFDSDRPYRFDAERFGDIAGIRNREGFGSSAYSSEEEQRIWNLVKNQKVQGDYRGTLQSAMDQLSRQASINIIFDNIAMSAEGVQSDRSIDVEFIEPISLRSALTVILGQVGLVFVVEDEVIKVTSRDAQRRDVRPVTYYVGDLVTPITNFGHSTQMNFMQPTQGYNLGFNSNQLSGQPASAMPLANRTSAAAHAMAQQLPNGLANGGFGLAGYGGGAPQSGTPIYNTVGPPSLGGVTEADFDPLIELIKSTINPDGWEDTNGDGTIQAFVPNLSLIVSQTQEVQDQIQDLLKKLRELNDVQIVIEVRFITLQDSFFERIGIDFDFQINDDSNITGGTLPDRLPGGGSAVIGNTELGPTPDLDIIGDQGSFASAIPQFGGFDAGTAANFGFAILSDIEVFFLIQASKGDTRSNITAAPTVTMFNGQSASVIDGAQRPFVTSVTPVVGDFAVAQQPVITILPEGTSLNVQAVVSSDRRFVRMTLVPFFSQIEQVDTFTFDGTTTTRRSSDSLLDDLIDTVAGNDDNGNIDEFETEVQGVTIQLPILAATSVSTVVSVPDGGTVLMGGVKSMAEGRIERGVPFLSGIPYVNRLFKNTGIGRETSNRMMMVTPRIIIQEEEERIQVGDTGF